LEAYVWKEALGKKIIQGTYKRMAQITKIPQFLMFIVESSKYMKGPSKEP